MSRIEKTHKSVTLNIRLPEPVAHKLEILTFDPIANRARYGLKSHIFAALVERLIDATAQGAPAIQTDDLSDLLRRDPQ